MKVLTASNPVAGLLSLPFRDKLRVLRTLALVQLQARQKIKPYQQLRYWSNVPFRHGPIDVVKHSATPFPDNPARPLQRNNPNALQDELIRHLNEDRRMSGFDFGLQFLDAGKMTYWGKRQDANFWIENASVEWNEAEAPFHTVARLTLLSNSQLPLDAGEAIYFDVTGQPSVVTQRQNRGVLGRGPIPIIKSNAPVMPQNSPVEQKPFLQCHRRNEANRNSRTLCNSLIPYPLLFQRYPLSNKHGLL